VKQKRIRTPKRGKLSDTTQKIVGHLLRLADPDRRGDLEVQTTLLVMIRPQSGTIREVGSWPLMICPYSLDAIRRLHWQCGPAQLVKNPLEQAVALPVSLADNWEEKDGFDALYALWVNFQTELALGGMPLEVAD
jgi:hypothetical protein